LNPDPNHPHRALFGPSYSASKTVLNAITLAFALDANGPTGLFSKESGVIPW
jgi:hypothetical protein